MKRFLFMVVCAVGITGFGSAASAGVVLYADGPATATVGEEIPLRLRARVTEAINAVKTTVAVSPGTVRIVRFDDMDAAIRLWLNRGIEVPDGVLVEGVIPGGIGPAFTDIVELGTLWVSPGATGTLTVTFHDSEIYLHQPTPTLSDVLTESYTVRVDAGQSPDMSEEEPAVVLDADVRIVSEPNLHDGSRSVIFDIKTDKGSADTVRIRERWLGLAGRWREISSPAALSDSWGVSILDVALSDSQGGTQVASVVPVTLKVLWGAVTLGVLALIRRYLKKRHR